jgi:hypothetical protein
LLLASKDKDILNTGVLVGLLLCQFISMDVR